MKNLVLITITVLFLTLLSCREVTDSASKSNQMKSPGVTTGLGNPKDSKVSKNPSHSKKVNDKERIEQFCKEREIKIIYSKWQLINSTIDDLSTTKFDKDGYLIELDLSGNLNIGVNSLDLTQFTKLKILSLKYCLIWDIKRIKLPVSVEELDLENNVLDERYSFDLSYLKNLKILVLHSNRIGSLKSYKFPTSLKTLSLSRNPLGKFNLKHLSKLETLLLLYSNIQEIDSSFLPLSLKKLYLSYNKHITKLDLHNFTTLEHLDLSNIGLDSKKLISFKLPISLKNIRLAENINLTSVDLKYLIKLEGVQLYACGIKDLSLSNLPYSLKHLGLFGNKELTKLDVKKYLRLEKIELGGTGINSLKNLKLPNKVNYLWISLNKDENHDLTSLTNLKSLYLIGSKLSNLKKLKMPESLVYITCQGITTLQSAEIKDQPNLERIGFPVADLIDLRLSNLPKLKELDLRRNKRLSLLTLNNFPSLGELTLVGCNLKNLKLSNLPKLTEINLKQNTNLTRIDLSISPKLKTLEYTEDQTKLKEILLHTKNQAHSGITKIQYTRDQYDRITSVQFLNPQGKYANHPKLAYAKRIVRYDSKGKKAFDETYEANQVNTFTFKDIAFKHLSEKLKIYPSQTNDEKHPVIGLVTLKNPLSEAVTLTISLKSDQFKAFFPSSTTKITTDLTLKAHETKTLRVFLPFRESLWKNKQDILVHGTLIITGKAKSGMKSKTYEAPFGFKLMAMKKMKWDDIRNIAPYGSINDPVIIELAKAVENMNNVRHPQVPSNTIDRYLKAYEVIRALKVNYSSMPRGGLDDEIQTPQSMIQSRLKTGKCTDTVILYASLLQRLGYSVIITTFDYQKGNDKISHLMLLIDTGVNAKDYRFLHHNKAKLFTFGDNSHCYIPIETTAITSGIQSKDLDFLSAWEKGLTQVNQHRDQILNPKNTFRLDVAWHRGFKPIKPNVKAKYEIHPSIIDKATLEIEELQRTYVESFLESKTEYQKLKANLNESNYPSVYNLTQYLFTKRRYQEANQYFERSVQIKPNPEALYYYTATLVYMSLTKDRHITTALKRQSRKKLQTVMQNLSRQLVQKSATLNLNQRWSMNYDLSKWFNRFDQKAKAKTHKALANQAFKEMNQVKHAYTQNIIQKLKSKALSDSMITKLQKAKIDHKTVIRLLDIGFKEKMLSKLLSKGYSNTILGQLTLKTLSKGDYEKHLNGVNALRYIRSTKSMDTQYETKLKGFREDTIIAIGVKGFSEDDSLSITTKGLSEEDELSVATKGFSEEDSIALASKGFSEEDALTSATKGYSEEVWTVTRRKI